MCLHRLEGRKMSKPHCHPSFLFVSFCLSKRRLFSPSSSLLFSSFFSSSSASSMFHELLQSVCHCPDHPPLPPFAPALPSLPPSILLVKLKGSFGRLVLIKLTQRRDKKCFTPPPHPPIISVRLCSGGLCDLHSAASDII